MITREEILEIEQYCENHSKSVSSRLDELNITRNSYYRAKLNDVTLEPRTAGGSAMRISGVLTDAAVLGIVEALNGGHA